MMAAKQVSEKRYVVRLSDEERERLEVLIRQGTSPAKRLLKARILLKADVSQDRNANHTKANWHFTTPDARIKLKHLYPAI
jgi:hypothetical protein